MASRTRAVKRQHEDIVHDTQHLKYPRATRVALEDVSNRNVQQHQNLPTIVIDKPLTRSRASLNRQRKSQKDKENNNERQSISTYTHSQTRRSTRALTTTTTQHQESIEIDDQNNNNKQEEIYGYRYYDEEEEEEEAKENNDENEEEEEADDQDENQNTNINNQQPANNESEVKKKTSTIIDVVSVNTSVTTIPSQSQSTSISLSTPASRLSAAEVAAAIAKWQQSIEDNAHNYDLSIFTHLRSTESFLMPSSRYLDTIQGDLSYPMRAILIDWLVEVGEEYHLQAQTLFLSIAYTDRFLSHTPIDRSRLQLVGITAMLIAAKYWEIYPPTIDDFVYISDHTYQRDHVLDMERAILTCLKFKLTIPTSWEFSQNLLKVCSLTRIQEALMDYLMTAFLQEPQQLIYTPSIVASSALYLALHTITVNTTPTISQQVEQALWKHTGYSISDLKPCITVLYTLHVRLCLDPNGNIAAGSAGLKAVKVKYSKSNHHHIARVKPRANFTAMFH